MGEVLFIASLICGLVLPFVLLTGVGRKYWLIMMCVIGATLGITEGIAKIIHDATISQMFWVWSTEHPKGGHLVLALLVFGWGTLIFHLGEKMWFKPDYYKKKKIGRK